MQKYNLLRTADDIVSSASETQAGSVAFGLFHTAPIAGFAHSLPNAIMIVVHRSGFV